MNVAIAFSFELGDLRRQAPNLKLKRRVARRLASAAGELGS